MKPMDVMVTARESGEGEGRCRVARPSWLVTVSWLWRCGREKTMLAPMTGWREPCSESAMVRSCCCARAHKGMAIRVFRAMESRGIGVICRERCLEREDTA